MVDHSQKTNIANDNHERSKAVGGQVNIEEIHILPVPSARRESREYYFKNLYPSVFQSGRHGLRQRKVRILPH